ncbi:MAG: 23S rRNA (guanosine(2251)-2'-O)-methyltransferase RlmB [Deltaproteobacteria bacterium]|nr:23S rRNA (guanosine(2251)-2'-O)-methyltransferase RlmB [Deltaproteobacteria bacterium]
MKSHDQSAQGAAVHILFGRKPVLEILKHQPKRLQELYIQKGAKLPGELTVALAELIASRKCLTRELEERDLTERFQTDRHQGIVAVLKPPSSYSLEELLVKSKKRNGLLVITDQVIDPQNLGSIMRCAEAAGADGLLMTSDHSAKVSASVLRASAGASELLPLVVLKNLQRSIKEIKEAGFWVVGLDAGEGAQNLYELEIPQPVAVILGSEGKGLRQLTQRECDLLVAIPMRGLIESLNVGQAAAVCLFELLRRAQKIN